MIQEGQTDSGQPVRQQRSFEGKSVRPPRGLTAELREISKQVLSYGVIATLTTVTLALLAIVGVVSRFITLPFDYSHYIFLHIALSFVTSLISFYYIIKFDAANKTGRAIFESVTQTLEAKEKLAGRKSRKSQVDNEPSASAAKGSNNAVQNEPSFYQSHEYTRVALSEYNAARVMPFMHSYQSSRIYFLVNIILSLMSILTPALIALFRFKTIY
jgi:hypothetical protein